MLAQFIEQFKKEKTLPQHILTAFETIRLYGNLGAHSQGEAIEDITPEYVQSCLHSLNIVVRWYFKKYYPDEDISIESIVNDETKVKNPLLAIGNLIKKDWKFHFSIRGKKWGVQLIVFSIGIIWITTIWITDSNNIIHPTPTPIHTGITTPIPNSYTPVSSEGELIFHEGFEKGIQRNVWEKDGEKIEVVNDPIYGQCARISRRSPGGWASLRKKFRGYSGKLIFEAMIKIESIIPGKEEWQCARFDAVISKPTKQQKQYPGHNYDKTFDWTLERFETDSLDGSETVELMISVLQTKGTIYIDEIKVYHLP